MGGGGPGKGRSWMKKRSPGTFQPVVSTATKGASKPDLGRLSDLSRRERHMQTSGSTTGKKGPDQEGND